MIEPLVVDCKNCKWICVYNDLHLFICNSYAETGVINDFIVAYTQVGQHQLFGHVTTAYIANRAITDPLIVGYLAAKVKGML
jgi:hypothetical protein